VTNSIPRVDALFAGSALGDKSAEAALMDLVYGELRRIASSFMRRERAGHSLQTSALVNEAYLRLAGRQANQLKNRSLFFTAAARAMRRVLIEHARRRQAAKRDGGLRVDLESAIVVEQTGSLQLIELDSALERLAEFDPRQAQIVELRFFAGLSVEETAEATGLSPRTVKRDWQVARAWLKGEMERL